MTIEGMSVVERKRNGTNVLLLHSYLLKQELQNLNKEEKELINSRYVYGETQREVADLLNTNQVDVSRKEKKILLKLKTRLKS